MGIGKIKIMFGGDTTRDWVLRVDCHATVVLKEVGRLVGWGWDCGLRN